MRFLDLANYRDLDPAPRRFIGFMLFNVLSWQGLAGPAMVLFARSIEMPVAWVGVLMALMPFSQYLVVVTPPLVARFGPKRLLLAMWAARNAVMMSVFAMPWVLAWGGKEAGWLLLFGATAGFCIARSTGAGGWMPWLHEIIPSQQRPLYFGAEAAVTHLSAMSIILVQGLLLMGEPTVWQFAGVYALGIGAGFASLIMMARIPGGQGAPGISMRHSFKAYAAVFEDKPYLRFLGIIMLGTSAFSLYGATHLLYLRDGLGFAETAIMMITAGGSLSILLTVRLWGKLVQRRGNSWVMVFALACHLAVCLGSMLLPASYAITSYLILPLIMGAYIFTPAYGVPAHSATLDFFQEHARIGYANAWTAAMATSMGLTPICAGLMIDALGPWGYPLCFGLAALMAAIAAAIVRVSAEREAAVIVKAESARSLAA